MKRFSIVNTGYDVDEVNRFIDIVIGRLEKLNAENASYSKKIEELNKALNEKKNNEHDTSQIEKTLIAVQEASEKMKEMAQEEARMIVEEAKTNASSIVHEALVSAEKTEQERMLLEKNIKVYKQRMKTLVEGQLDLIEDLDKMEIEKGVK